MNRFHLARESWPEHRTVRVWFANSWQIPVFRVWEIYNTPNICLSSNCTVKQNLECATGIIFVFKNTACFAPNAWFDFQKLGSTISKTSTWNISQRLWLVWLTRRDQQESSFPNLHPPNYVCIGYSDRDAQTIVPVFDLHLFSNTRPCDTPIGTIKPCLAFISCNLSVGRSTWLCDDLQMNAWKLECMLWYEYRTLAHPCYTRHPFLDKHSHPIPTSGWCSDLSFDRIPAKCCFFDGIFGLCLKYHTQFGQHSTAYSSFLSANLGYCSCIWYSGTKHSVSFELLRIQPPFHCLVHCVCVSLSIL